MSDFIGYFRKARRPSMLWRYYITKRDIRLLGKKFKLPTLSRKNRSLEETPQSPGCALFGRDYRSLEKI